MGLVPAGLHLNLFAQNAAYPDKPARIIVGFAAGGGTDVLARIFAKSLEDNFGKPFVVDNKTGASGSIAAVHVARADPDGYTLLMAADAHLIYPHLSTGLTYQAVDDFTPIACLSSGPQCIAVHPDFPCNSIEELITLSRKEKTGIDYATGGAGTLTHMVMELLKANSDINLSHIPFKGSGPSLIPVIAGDIPVLSAPLGTVLPHINSKKLKPIAVTSSTRSKFLPNVPTVSETAGFETYEASSWVGLLGPKDTSQEAVHKINAFARKLSTDNAFIERLDKNAWNPVNLTPEEFKLKMINDSIKWKDLIEKEGIKLDA